MWDAIQYVTSWLTLIAFLFAVLAWVYKSKSEERERLIKSANDEKRADLVRLALEFFDVDSSTLTTKQKYELALAQIHARTARFRTTAIVVCTLALILAAVSMYAINQNGKHQNESDDGSSKGSINGPTIIAPECSIIAIGETTVNVQEAVCKKYNEITREREEILEALRKLEQVNAADKATIEKIKTELASIQNKLDNIKAVLATTDGTDKAKATIEQLQNELVSAHMQLRDIKEVLAKEIRKVSGNFSEWKKKQSEGPSEPPEQPEGLFEQREQPQKEPTIRSQIINYERNSKYMPAQSSKGSGNEDTNPLGNAEHAGIPHNIKQDTVLEQKRPICLANICYTEQGKQWTHAARLQYYSQDQGSRLMPLKWFLALKQPNGKPFLDDSLSRYGYLPNPASKTKGLPVGFTSNGSAVGMTCSACHTREIEVDGAAYRIDGGPAIADFQSFAADLDNAVGQTLNDQYSFDAFAAKVLGGVPSSDQKTKLRKEVETWYLPYHTIMSIALPKEKPWGPSRLDAVTMILNRLTGLDIGTTPDHIIQSNIRLADAPVRYPFIWNAPIQDKTQWPGFADNGNALLGLSRNYGEVLGVFADFYPQKAPWRILGYDYLEHNSANFDGLKAVENLVNKIGPPEWPWKEGKWAVDAKLASQGKRIYESKTKTENGGCAACHGIREGVPRALNKTWATPLCYVGTDAKEFDLFALTVDTGVLAGAKIPFLEQPLKAKDENAVKVLSLVGMGTLLQYTKSPKTLDLELKAQTKLGLIERLAGDVKNGKIKQIADQLRKKQAELITPENALLKGVYRPMPAAPKGQTDGYRCKDKFTDPNPAIAYESRVLQGIWATAPYLHNGSVPTLAALLEPVQNRPAEFKIGPAYDPGNVGLAVEQSKFDYVLKTTGCGGADIKSGNSRCGHEFGTRLSKEEKAALLEYLKVL